MLFTTDWENRRAKDVSDQLTKLVTTPNRNEQLPRDDYKELLELALLLNSQSSPRQITIKKPGAHNKARWMCVLIYRLKMFWFQDQEVLAYTQDFKDNLSRFVKFALLVYIPYWFKVTLSSDAAVNDLDLYKQLLQYNDIDPDVSLVVLKAQSRHYWYLVPDSIILWSMFGDELTDDEKGRICLLYTSDAADE